MLIPLGSEDNRLRAAPLVTFVLIGLSFVCSVLYLYALPNEDFPTEVYDFYARHSYLKLDPRLELPFQIEASSPPPTFDGDDARATEVLAADQAKLDQLCKAYLRRFDHRKQLRFGVVPGQFSLLTAFSHMLITPGIFVLLMQSLFIYMCAPFVEDFWGRRLMTGFLLGSAFVSAVGFSLFASNTTAPLLGISGVTASIMAAICVHFPKRRMHILLALGRMFTRDLWVPTWVLSAVWLVSALFVVLIDAFIRSESSEITLGSLFFAVAWGAGFALSVHYLELNKKYNPTAKDLLPREARYLEEIDESLRLSKRDEALALLFKAHGAFPKDLLFHKRLWEQLVRTGKVPGHQKIGVRLIDALLQQQQAEAAYFTWEELSKETDKNAVAQPLSLRLSRELIRVGHLDQARRVLHQAWLNWDPRQEREALFQLIAELAQVDERLCLKVIQEALAKLSFSSTESASLSAMEANLAKRVKPLEDVDYNPIEVLPLPPPPDFNPFKPTRIEKMHVFDVELKAVKAEGLLLQKDEQTKTLPWSQIKGLAGTEIRPIGDDPHFILDLHLLSPLEAAPLHKLYRINSTRLPGPQKGDDQGIGFLRKLALHVCHKAQIEAITPVSAQDSQNYLSLSDFEKNEYGITYS